MTRLSEATEYVDGNPRLKPGVSAQYQLSELRKFIILYYNYSGVIEVGVFATEDVAEGIVEKMGGANHQVGAVM